MNAERTCILDHRGEPMQASDTAYFAASRTKRELAAWLPPLESADLELAGEAPTIAARSYDLERNHGVATGALRTQVDNIVGTGLRLAAKPDYRALGRDKVWADAWALTAEAQWRTFADVPEFDAARQLNFGGSTVLQIRSAMLAGDGVALALWLPDRPGAKWATAVQSIDPARLSNPDWRVMDARLRDGVEINEYGEPVAYWIRRTHPSESYLLGGPNGFERVPARTAFGRRRVLHLYEKLRPGQSRGRAILASVIGAFRMLDHYQRTELQTAVVNSMIAAFIKTPLRGEDIAELFGSGKQFIESKAGWEVQLQGGSVLPLHPGDDIEPFTPTRPNSAYAQFVEAVLRYIGTGLNLPYELLMKDFSKTNYSSARAALLEAWRYFLSMRRWLAMNWASPIYELWLEEAVNRDVIEAPDFYENRAAYCRAEWIGPGRGWIDPLKEAQAADSRMNEAGISTLERECAEQGLDWQEVIEQRATEREFAAGFGLDVHRARPAQLREPVPEAPGTTER